MKQESMMEATAQQLHVEHKCLIAAKDGVIAECSTAVQDLLEERKEREAAFSQQQERHNAEIETALLAR